MRLQKFIAQCGIASRRKAEELISAGRVEVNGKTVTELGTKVDPDVDTVFVDGKELSSEEKGVLLFHKPTRVMSTKDDPEGRETIMDHVPDDFASYFPVGRLDYDSAGLMILTNDGELADRLMHPRFESERVYEVKVRNKVENRTLKKMADGVRLDDGLIKAKVSVIKFTDASSTWLRVVIKEGRNRIIRRMLESVGHPVQKLQRIQHGPFELGDLKLGECKKLSYGKYQKALKHLLSE